MAIQYYVNSVYGTVDSDYESLCKATAQGLRNNSLITTLWQIMHERKIAEKWLARETNGLDVDCNRNSVDHPGKQFEAATIAVRDWLAKESIWKEICKARIGTDSPTTDDYQRERNSLFTV